MVKFLQSLRFQTRFLQSRRFQTQSFAISPIVALQLQDRHFFGDISSIDCPSLLKTSSYVCLLYQTKIKCFCRNGRAQSLQSHDRIDISSPSCTSLLKICSDVCLLYQTKIKCFCRNGRAQSLQSHDRIGISSLSCPSLLNLVQMSVFYSR